MAIKNELISFYEGRTDRDGLDDVTQQDDGYRHELPCTGILGYLDEQIRIHPQQTNQPRQDDCWQHPSIFWLSSMEYGIPTLHENPAFCRKEIEEG